MTGMAGDARDTTDATSRCHARTSRPPAGSDAKSRMLMVRKYKQRNLQYYLAAVCLSYDIGLSGDDSGPRATPSEHIDRCALRKPRLLRDTHSRSTSRTRQDGTVGTVRRVLTRRSRNRAPTPRTPGVCRPPTPAALCIGHSHHLRNVAN